MANETVLDRLLRGGGTGGDVRGGQPSVAPPKPPPSSLPYKTDIVLSRPADGKPKKKGDGFDAGDVFGFVGKGLSKAIDVADIGRAALVSGTRELADLWPGDEEQASWQDFKDQFNRRATAQELLFTGPYFKLDEKGWEDEILGFATDIVLDPLTYTPGVLAKQAIKVGAKGIALTKPQKALKVAIKDGSAKVISKTVATNAAEAGLREAPEVQRLVALAASRGRGALTEKGLREAGVTAAQRTALGLSAEGPGALRRVLQSAENLKGAVKQPIRESAFGRTWRKAFVPETGGRRALLDIALDSAAAMSRRADAILVSATINPAKQVANQWGAEAMRTAELELLGSRKVRGVLRGITDEQAKTLTRNIEAGVAGAGEDAMRAQFRRLRDDLVRAGVDVGDLGENYLPHMRTEVVIKLAKKNDEVNKILSSFNTKEGFQKFRTLRPGDAFLNETEAAARQAAEAGSDSLNLVNGSIDEINERFREKFGVDLFVDDARELLPRYIKQGERAMFRRTQLRLLKELGFTEGLATKMVRRTDPEHMANIDAAKIRLAEEKAKRTVALADGSVVRRDNLLALRDQVAKRKQMLEGRINQIERRLVDLSRDQTAARSAIEFNQQSIALLRQQVDDLSTAAKAARGEERRALLAKRDRAIRTRDNQIPKLQAKIDDIEREIASMMRQARTPKEARRVEQATGGMRGSIEGLQAQRAALIDQAQRLTDEYQDLTTRFQQSGLGMLPSDIESSLFTASDVLESFIRDQDKLLSAEQFADTVYLFAQADARWAVDALRRQLAELDATFDVADLGNIKVPKKVTPAVRDDLRDRFNTVLTVLQRQDNTPEVQAIAKLEAVAAKSDMEVWQAGNQVKKFEQMLKDLESEKVSEITKRARAGMVRIGNELEMPEWLFEATKLDWVRTELPNIGRWGRKYFNLFKGYAILRPGFHVRNLYSAMFNMYLEAGAKSFKNVKKWHQFYTMATHNPEGYWDEAVKKFGLREATMLNQAYGAISATGAGQIASEFAGTGFKAASKNPFDENNMAMALSRRIGGWVEDHVRGAHAYDVLTRGGTLDQAIDIVTKWHFDYTDVTKFDQAMKLVNPFWIFFSRNMALQAQTWVGNLPKLNRTIINFERNMNYGLQEDDVVPEYYHTEGAIRLPFKGYQGSTLYFFSDLPAVTFPGELERVTNPTSPRFFADLGPFFKIPVEMIAKRQLFSDIPIDPTKPAELPFGIGNIPGAGNLGFSPGVDTTGSGRLVADPVLMNAVMSALPGIGQLQRIAPVNDPKLLARLPYTLLSTFGGISLAENTPRAQQGELYRRSLELAQEREKQRRLLEM